MQVVRIPTHSALLSHHDESVFPHTACLALKDTISCSTLLLDKLSPTVCTTFLHILLVTGNDLLILDPENKWTRLS